MAKALAPDISTWPAENPQLIGAQCDACQATTWPKQNRCPRCSGPDMKELLLPRKGTLLAWTTQEFVPKLPWAGSATAANFKPFGVGLVQLGDVVRVEAHLTENDPATLESVTDVELTFIPFYTDADGEEVFTVAFAPV